MNADVLRNDALFMAIFGEDGLKDMTDEEFADYMKPVNDDLPIESLDWSWAKAQASAA